MPAKLILKKVACIVNTEGKSVSHWLHIAADSDSHLYITDDDEKIYPLSARTVTDLCLHLYYRRDEILDPGQELEIYCQAARP